MKGLFYLLLIPLFFACSENSVDEVAGNLSEQDSVTVLKDTVEIQEEPVIKNYEAKPYYTEGVGWGYVILVNDKPYINQPHIPAVPGTKGFSSEEKALKNANFVIYKLQNGIMPPSVTLDELDSLGVLD
ncbi:MAG: DUF4907 domain-containing protein [Flavobacteriales bacterium]|nr:DUF4907 domain-containing protein [Flavobacteriales bacterium]